MLERGNHRVRLHPFDQRAAQRSGQQRIFAQIFEIAARTRIAHQVDSAGQHHVEALGACLRSDHAAGFAHQRRIPACRQRHSRWQRGGDIALAHVEQVRHAERGIGADLRRNAKPGNAGNLAGAHRDTGRAAVMRHQQRKLAVKQRDLVIAVHGPDLPARPSHIGAFRLMWCMVPGMACVRQQHRCGQQHPPRGSERSAHGFSCLSCRSTGASRSLAQRKSIY